MIIIMQRILNGHQKQKNENPKMNSKNAIDFLKSHKIKILIILLVFFFLRSCNNGRSIKKLERSQITLIKQIDSLNSVIVSRDSEIKSFPEILRLQSLSIHQDYDLWISKLDRSPQLMELHNAYVKLKIKEFSK